MMFALKPLPPRPRLLTAYHFDIETFTLSAPQILHFMVQHIALSRDPLLTSKD